MSLTDYSKYEDQIKDAPEPKTLTAGTEIKARIIAVRTGVSDKNDCKWYSPVFDVPDDPMVIEFNAFFWELDEDKLSKKEFSRTLFQFQQFAKCFDIDYSRPFNWEEDLIGKEGWLIVGLKKSDEYGDQNTVKKYIAGR